MTGNARGVTCGTRDPREAAQTEQMIEELAGTINIPADMESRNTAEGVLSGCGSEPKESGINHQPPVWIPEKWRVLRTF